MFVKGFVRVQEYEYDCECGRLDICGLWFVCIGGGSVEMSLCGCLMLSIWLSGGGLGWLLVFLCWLVLRGWVHVCLCMCLILRVCGCKSSKVLLVRVSI